MLSALFPFSKEKKSREKASLLNVPVTELEPSTKLACDHAKAFFFARNDSASTDSSTSYKVRSISLSCMCTLRITSCYPLSEMLNLRANVSLSEGKWKGKI